MKKSERIGERHLTNENYWVQILEYEDTSNCTIKFDEGHIIKNVTYAQIKTGSIKNPYHFSVFGVGYLGVGVHVSRINDKITKSYQTWKSILEKCYCKNKLLYFPTYKDVTVCEEWHNYQNFAQWFYENYKEGLSLDRNLLAKGSKMFSSETCAFIPVEIINLIKDIKKRNLPTGVGKSKSKYKATLGKKYLISLNTPEEAFEAYKIAKELQVKERANKWKHVLKSEVYQVLLNYKVETAY